VLHTGQCVLEALARRGESTTDAWVDTEFSDELPSVDLLGAEPANVVIIGAHALDRLYGSTAPPRL
jgi:hypothetical protein